MRTLTAHGQTFTIKRPLVSGQLAKIMTVAKLTKDAIDDIDRARSAVFVSKHNEARKLTEKATRKQRRAARLREELKDVLA